MIDALTYLRKVDSSGLEIVKLREKPVEEFCEVKFSVDREELLRVLNGCISVVPQKDRVPVIMNCLVEVGKQVVRVTVTNQEIFVRATIQKMTWEKTGKILIPARKLLPIVRDSSGDVVYIESSNRTISVACADNSWQIARPVVGPELFPDFNVDCELFTTVDKATFYKAVESVKYAARKDFSRANLRLIKVDCGRFSAYDGNRFQRITTDLTDLSMDIPAFSIDLLLKKLKSSNLDTVTVGTNEDFLFFILENEVFASKRNKLEYPNVDTQVLRPVLANRHEFVCSKKELIDCIKAVRINSDTEYNAVGILLAENQAEVFTRDGENRASTHLSCTWKGKKRLVVVSHVQLKELLDAHAEDTCRFFLGDDSKMRKSTLMLKANEDKFIGFVSQLAATAIGVREVS